VGYTGAVIVDLQLNPAVTPWPELREAVLAAEDAGYSAVWVFDHLAGAVLHGDTMLECFTLAGALAAATTTIGIGTMVVNNANRAAAVTATAAASVQAISGGRFLLGIGAGPSPSSRFSVEHRAVGIDLLPKLSQRHAALGDTLDLLDTLWAADRPEACATFPRPEPRPPVYIGVNSPELAGLAGGRADGLNVFWNHPRRDELTEVARRAAGDRPFALTTWSLWDDALVDPASAVRAEIEAAGFERLVVVDLGPADLGRIRSAVLR
jgi:alkanesulfonate monooxygenase SsuD/methylene tetrahydromethanopterin reductase-like flavin-dependent oxidoreductase (luciferase family)